MHWLCGADPGCLGTCLEKSSDPTKTLNEEQKKGSLIRDERPESEAPDGCS